MATVSKPRLNVGKIMSGRFGKERATTCSEHEKGFSKKSYDSVTSIIALQLLLLQCF